MWPARLAVALLLAGTVPLTASPARAEWLAGAQGGLLYEDNLNRAARERDQKSDLALAPRLSVSPRFQSPRGRAQWARLVPSAARRAADGRVGDGAGPAGTTPCARTRPPPATTVPE